MFCKKYIVKCFWAVLLFSVIFVLQILPAYSTDTITFEDICKKAYAHSYDLQIADFNILIAQQDVRGARSEYFPKLYASAGAEYTKNLNDISSKMPMYVGESYINPYTRYQSVVGVTLNYNLFDFGVRRGHLNIAKETVKINTVKQAQALQELNLTLLDNYAKVLMLTKQIELNNQILAINERNIQQKNRLYKAKVISKTELNDYKAKKHETENRIVELKKACDESLKWLSFLTGEEYDVEKFKPAKFKVSSKTQEYNDYTKSLVWQLYEKELKKKELEIKVAKRNNYPKINAYGRYYMYGMDKSKYADTWDNFKPSNYTVGGSISMTAFDGFKNQSLIKKTELEYRQLLVERDKSIAQFTTRLAVMRSNLMYFEKQNNINDEIIKELTDKDKSLARLVAQKVSTPIEKNNSEIAIIMQKIEKEKYSINSDAIRKGIEILTQTQGINKDL